jgi:hypothetical protein
MKAAEPALVVVWWLWLVIALLALPLPVEWAVAVYTRGLDSVRSSGISGGGFALIGVPAILALVSFPPLLVLSSLYAFLFWNARRRSVRLRAWFWVPIYGSVMLIAVLSLMVLLALQVRAPMSELGNAAEGLSQS